MNPSQITFLSLSSSEFEDSQAKNAFIRKTSSPYVGFINSDITNSKEVLDILQEMNIEDNIDYIVLGENVPLGDFHLEDVIKNMDMKVYSLIVCRDVFTKCGSFNEKLLDATNYELLCRLSLESAGLYIPCVDESFAMDMQEARIHTYAYTLRLYMETLKNEGNLESVFSHFTSDLDSCELGIFETHLARLLDDYEYFYNIQRNTAPILIISGDKQCFGVLNDFACELAKSLAHMGQAVVATDGRYGDFDKMEINERLLVKGVIGFQAMSLEKDYFRKIHGPKLQFWFDNPIFFNDMLHDLSKDYYILCQDEFYGEYIKKFYNTQNAIVFPPAGRLSKDLPDDKKDYDVTFIGKMMTVDLSRHDDFMKVEYFNYMIANPTLTFEEGLYNLLNIQGKKLCDESFQKLLHELSDVCRNVIAYYKQKVLETILAAGIKVHVFGTSWEGYDGKGKENLLLHPDVSVDEALRIMASSKISLNIMSWHKAGMTERIANITMAGAVCLSDETTYLRNNFTDGEDIVLFGLDELEQLPCIINNLLSNDKKRKDIGLNGRKKAVKYHTWDVRAREIVKMLNEDITL